MESESNRPSPADGGVLRRMLRRAPPSRAPAADPGGLREVAPRILDRVAGLAVRLGEPSVTALSRDDLGEAIPKGALILRLRPKDGSYGGLAWLAPDLFAALVERRFTGGLRSNAPEIRPATPLDAVICAELLDAFCEEPGVVAGPPVRTGAHLRDPDLSVELEDTAYRLTRVRLALGREGDRGGELALALPEPPPAPEAVPAPGGARADLRGCHAEVEASLAPLRLSWSRVIALAPDDRIGLPESVLDEVRLLGIDGRSVAFGRLGRMGDRRAIRLNVPVDPLPAPQLRPAAPPALEGVYEEAPPEP